MIAVEHTPLSKVEDDSLRLMFASPSFKDLIKIARSHRDEQLLLAAEALHSSVVDETNEKGASDNHMKSASEWEITVRSLEMLASKKEPFTSISIFPSVTK